MFKSVLENAASEQTQLQRKKVRAHAAAVKATPALVDACVDYLNKPVSEIYTNQKEIEQEQQAVKAEIQRLVDNTARLSTLVRSVQHGLKELGDFENYLAICEEQAAELAAAWLGEQS
uniref:Biogenesis of lysosome-related organelles complex 1 subunit 1 n=1 Tax=Chlamydomonas leiostraca TaxID=1034604 RepID=A0A7S0WT60_9CHLO|mmetsp:Transcript_27679/g.70499  ORF Transcript_27679/g.70499 Transcript_27679/m.70499 type:complete len:118 (+) Transcript_27679:44-397(+)